jgi:hypothetical protein
VENYESIPPQTSLSVRWFTERNQVRVKWSRKTEPEFFKTLAGLKGANHPHNQTDETKKILTAEVRGLFVALALKDEKSILTRTLRFERQYEWGISSFPLRR